MSILTINADFVGQVGAAPRLVRITCNDTLTTIQTPGYINQNSGYTVAPTDVIFISYAGGLTGIFIPSIAGSTGVVTLVENINMTTTGARILYSNASGLTAHAGASATNATPITAAVSQFTTVASSGDSAVLPTSMAGLNRIVINAAASNAMNVYPAGTDTINALSGGTAFSLAANKTALFVCPIAGKWYSILTA